MIKVDAKSLCLPVATGGENEVSMADEFMQGLLIFLVIRLQQDRSLVAVEGSKLQAPQVCRASIQQRRCPPCR